MRSTEQPPPPPDPLATTILGRIAPALLASRGEDLASFAAFCAGELDEQAAYSDRIAPPVWKNVPADPAHPGTRRGAIFLNPHYEACHQEVYARGFIAAALDENAPTQLYALVGQYLVSQSDISIGCPFAMTHPVALIVARYASDAVRQKFLAELTRTDGRTKSGGTWATEKHSGSDVGETATVAMAEGNARFRLHGQKWFTSNAGSGLALATARPEGAAQGGKGLGLYLVPSHIDEDWRIPNAYEITHLKEKIGTRALATGEIRLDGALGYEIAAPPDGLKVMMAALGCSRAHNAMAAAGVMRRAFTEALAWTSERETFGKKLIAHPLVRKRLIEIAAQWVTGTLLAFEAARSFDAAWDGDDEAARLWSRMTTALAKYKTAEQAVWCSQKALALFGGNGYTEDYPIARAYRDAMVLPVWEGPEQIQALELLRLITGKLPGAALFMARLDAILGSLPADMAREKARLQALRDGTAAALDALLTMDDTEPVADSYLHGLSDTFCYALLLEHTAWALSQGTGSGLLPLCDVYYRETFERPVAPSAEPDPVLEHLDAIISSLAAAR